MFENLHKNTELLAKLKETVRQYVFDTEDLPFKYHLVKFKQLKTDAVE